MHNSKLGHIPESMIVGVEFFRASQVEHDDSWGASGTALQIWIISLAISIQEVWSFMYIHVYFPVAVYTQVKYYINVSVIIEIIFR